MAPKRCGNEYCVQHYVTVREAEENQSKFQKMKGKSTVCQCSSSIQYYIGGKWRRSGAVSLYYQNLQNDE